MTFLGRKITTGSCGAKDVQCHHRLSTRQTACTTDRPAERYGPNHRADNHESDATPGAAKSRFFDNGKFLVDRPVIGGVPRAVRMTAGMGMGLPAKVRRLNPTTNPHVRRPPEPEPNATPVRCVVWTSETRPHGNWCWRSPFRRYIAHNEWPAHESPKRDWARRYALIPACGYQRVARV